jgi:hypothetical protein
VSYPTNLITVLTSAADDTDQATYTTASVTFAEGNLYLLVYAARGTSASPAAATITKHTGGASAGFTSIATVSNAGTNMRTGVARLLPAAGAGFTDQIDLTFTATPIGAHWHIIEFAGVDQGGTNGANAIASQDGGATFASATALSASNPSSLAKTSNISLMIMKKDNTNAVTTTNGTALAATSGAAPVHMLYTGYQVNTGVGTDPDTSWTGSTNGARISVEIKTVDTQTIVSNTVAT